MKLEAGLELVNALVAEKVMGWRWDDYPWYDGTTKKILWAVEFPRGYDFDRLGDDKNLLILWGMPLFVEDMAAAWEVGQHFRNDVPEETYSDFADALTNEMSRFTDERELINPLEVFFILKTEEACLAICLAALKAVGVDVEKELAAQTP